VLSKNIPSLVQQQNLEEAKKWTAEWNMSVEDIMASQDEKFSKAVVALSLNLSLVGGGGGGGVLEKNWC
jgi:hypothetical protein